MAMIYDVAEYATAVKPSLLKTMLARAAPSAVVVYWGGSTETAVTPATGRA